VGDRDGDDSDPESASVPSDAAPSASSAAAARAWNQRLTTWASSSSRAMNGCCEIASLLPSRDGAVGSGGRGAGRAGGGVVGAGRVFRGAGERQFGQFGGAGWIDMNQKKQRNVHTPSP
jgi:hypothetical protein